MTKYKVTVIRRLRSEPILIEAEDVLAAIEHARPWAKNGVLPVADTLTDLTFEVEATL